MWLQFVNEYAVAWLGPPCARRTTTILSWGFREQEGPSQAGLLFPSPPKPLIDKKRKGGCHALTARMHRSPSEVRGARAQEHGNRPSSISLLSTGAYTSIGKASGKFSCARPTRAFRGRALREHKSMTVTLSSFSSPTRC